MISKEDIFNYTPDSSYSTPVAYFSMEFAVDQSLKIYSGGLGFLAGSHLCSAYRHRQNLVGIGMLWKYGYYDQAWDGNGMMKPVFTPKQYSYLTDTGVVFTVVVHDAPVQVKAWLLRPEVFDTAPLFLLSTDVAGNDELSRSITHYLYDANESTRIAQSIVLGAGGAMLLDLLKMEPAVYHMNEGHAIALTFYLYQKFRSMEEVRKRVVFTTHTPEMAGNEAHTYRLLREMSLFNDLSETEVKGMLGLSGDQFNYTLAALKFSKKANAVSAIHGKVALQMWGNEPAICQIIPITNAQNKTYWADRQMDEALNANNAEAFTVRKKALKRALFKVVADQCGKLFRDDVITIVWARRFAGYKRADLLLQDWEQFIKLVRDQNYPVQIIWAGKPYPQDAPGVNQFNAILAKTRHLPNCAVLTGYELSLSALLKQGSDVWLNNPRMYHEASGTSGMSAAMNGSLNLSMPDGWVPEFARHGENCFIISPAPDHLPEQDKDRFENAALINMLASQIIPRYYQDQPGWFAMARQAAADVSAFESGRMAKQYYELLYNS